jgi:hypothetical protein
MVQRVIAGVFFEPDLSADRLKKATSPLRRIAETEPVGPSVERNSSILLSMVAGETGFLDFIFSPKSRSNTARDSFHTPGLDEREKTTFTLGLDGLFL